MQPASNTEFDKTLSHCHGDALASFSGQYELSPGVYPDDPLERVVMQFRKSLLDETKASILKTITSDDAAEIEITDPATWAFTVKRQDLGLPLGECYWGIWMEDDQGVGDTLGQGKINITPKVVMVPA